MIYIDEEINERNDVCARV